MGIPDKDRPQRAVKRQDRDDFVGPRLGWVPLSWLPWLHFRDGTKTVELRNNPARWRHMARREAARLRQGYSKRESDMISRVGRIAEAPDFASLPEWAKAGAEVEPGWVGTYFKPNEPIIAIEFPEVYGQTVEDDRASRARAKVGAYPDAK